MSQVQNTIDSKKLSKHIPQSKRSHHRQAHPITQRFLTKGKDYTAEEQLIINHIKQFLSANPTNYILPNIHWIFEHIRKTDEFAYFNNDIRTKYINNNHIVDKGSVQQPKFILSDQWDRNNNNNLTDIEISTLKNIYASMTDSKSPIISVANLNNLSEDAILKSFTIALPVTLLNLVKKDYIRIIDYPTLINEQHPFEYERIGFERNYCLFVEMLFYYSFNFHQNQKQFTLRLNDFKRLFQIFLILDSYNDFEKFMKDKEIINKHKDEETGFEYVDIDLNKIGEF